MNNNNAISIDTRIRYIRVSVKLNAREEGMSVERKRQVKAERRYAKEEASQMEEEIWATAMKMENQDAKVVLYFHIS